MKFDVGLIIVKEDLNQDLRLFAVILLKIGLPIVTSCLSVTFYCCTVNIIVFCS